MTGSQPLVGRLPDFIVIGAMKAGTTSLSVWLGAHPDVDLPGVKEPNFFSTPEKPGTKGIASYRALFAGTRPGFVTGEFSVAYSSPEKAGLAAERIST